MNHDDTVLLRLKRQYGKDEAFAELSKRLADAEFKLGELRSENEELKFKLNRYKDKPLPKEPQPAKGWKQDDAVKLIIKQYQVKLSKLENHKKSMEEWRAKYFNLLAKTSNNDGNTH